VKAHRVIGVDVGGTKILAALVSRDGSLERRREHPTPLESQEALFEALVGAVEEQPLGGVGAVGFGVPSRVDQERGVVGGSVNIPLHDLALRDRAAERLRLPVAIENDANAAALAEWTAGAGRGTRDMVMLTLGTGVGGGLVLGGRPYRGWAELGHIVVEQDGKPCQGTCTGHGHLESYCTGPAATEAAREVFGPAADAHRLVRLAREGDDDAREILAAVGRRLGAGIGSLVNVFHPQAVVIGGGFGVAAFEYLLPAAREVVAREALAPGGTDVRIVPAELGTAAGVIGAGLAAFAALDGDVR
jgi:glucokinase